VADDNFPISHVRPVDAAESDFIREMRVFAWRRAVGEGRTLAGFDEWWRQREEAAHG
jgi:hypothetical protein